MKDQRQTMIRRSDSISDSLNSDIKSLVSDAYDSGYEDGYEQGLDEMIESITENIGVDYAVEAFKECITLDDFQSKYRELTNLACTFMPTLGLKR